jgi:beta-lactamase superfamily II metal-dependent hydrolase
MIKPLVLLCTLLLSTSTFRAADTLDVYVLDTEGGKALVVQSPDGETLLVDAGYPTPDERDTKRVVAAAQSLGIKQFDFILATHHDVDHVGNILNVDARIPGRVFIDHGEPLPTATAQSVRQDYVAYVKCIGDRKRMIVKPGDTLPMKGVQITVVSSAGEALSRPLPGAGQPNEFCADAKPGTADTWDNAGSVGLLYQFGSFRMLDLGDLLQSIEYKLVCPTNLVGTVDLFMVSHHGFKVSNSRMLVHAVHPRAAIMNNGHRKGGEPQVLDILKSSPGFLDLWQLHFAPDAGDKNAPADFIANPDARCEAKMIKVSAKRDGTFTVTNLRNNFSKTYGR